MNKILPVLNPASLERSIAARKLLATLKSGPLTAAELHGVSDPGAPCVATLLEALEQVGLVRRIRSSSQEDVFQLLGNPATVLGVDLGGTKVHVALSDLSGTILAEAIEPTDPHGGVHVVEQIGCMADRLVKQNAAAASAPTAAVIGSPGALDPSSGKVSISPNIPGLEDFDIVQALQARIGCSVRVENDVNLAALGEQWHGSCAGNRNFAFVALGTGIGMGLVTDGCLVHGAHGAAGEIAYLPIGADPFDPASYPLGPLETAIGSAGILRAYRGRGSDAESVREIFDRSTAGEPAAQETLDDVARILVKALMAVRALVDPEVIVLGGSIGARAELVQRVHAIAAASPIDLAVRASSLGNRAVLIGANSLALADAHERLLGAAPPLN
jgi:predicted NBD/HSP70 family sugar kinase